MTPQQEKLYKVLGANARATNEELAAACAVARAWMTKRLFQYLDGEVGHD